MPVTRNRRVSRNRRSVKSRRFIRSQKMRGGAKKRRGSQKRKRSGKKSRKESVGRVLPQIPSSTPSSFPRRALPLTPSERIERKKQAKLAEKKRQAELERRAEFERQGVVFSNSEETNN